MSSDTITFDGVRITELRTFPPASALPYFYVTLNAEISLLRESSADLRHVLALPATRVSVDGQWILWALERKYPSERIEKLSGSDLIYRLADHCEATRSRLFLLGSTPEHNAAALQRLRERCPHAVIEGLAPPMFELGSPAEAAVRAAIRERLEAARPRYVVCGFGAPKEQAWALAEREWLAALGVEGTFFFGGSIDFVSGHLRRAPLLWQRVGLEGLYRVIQQPRRLLRLLRVLRVLPVIASGRY